MNRIAFCLLLPLLTIATGCREAPPAGEHAHGDGEAHAHDGETAGAGHEAEPWSVTAWSAHYELFAETEPLVAGREAPSHAHFTVLADFSALDRGSVTGILRDENGGEERFRAERPLRPGIFQVVFHAARQGDFALVFRVEEGGRAEDIDAGRVRVGDAEHPGGPSAPPPSAPPAAPAGQPVGFLKEQQWRTEFATAWAAEDALRRTLRAPARVVPPAGGEATLTAPVDGRVTAAEWPHVGRSLRRGAPVFTLVPQVTAGESVAALEAAVREVELELATARARRERLRELLAVEAASRREVEEAETRVEVLAARLRAAQRDRASAAALRGEGAAPESFRVTAPIDGQIAEVTVGPGQFVTAGAPLARLVRPRPVWLELALQPQQAAALTAAPAGLYVRRWAGEEPFPVPARQVRLVARAPAVAGTTGTVPVLLEVDRSVEALRLGSRVEVEVLLPGELRGVVLPASALVDDAGVEVVYVQLEGESFDRREVRVALREGPRVLVRGVSPGERVVVRGGNAIRRSELLGSGAVEGHVH